jgi:prevent-host-death family protein
MITVGLFDAKTHLPEIIRKVQAGEEVCVTRYDEEVAFLIPVNKFYQNKNHGLIQALIALKKRAPLSVNDVIELRDESRK